MYKEIQRHIDRAHLLKHLTVLREFQKDLGVAHLAATMLVAQVGHSEESSDLLHHRFVGVASIELENVFRVVDLSQEGTNPIAIELERSTFPVWESADCEGRSVSPSGRPPGEAVSLWLHFHTTCALR